MTGLKLPPRGGHLLCLLLALAISMPVAADWSIPAGATSTLAGGDARLGCTDLHLDGTLVVGAGGGISEVRHVFIGPGGRLQLEGGQLSLAQQWVVEGSVELGGGQVLRVDSAACPAVGPLGPIGNAPAAAVPVPTMGHLGLGLLVLLLATIAWRARPRPQ